MLLPGVWFWHLSCSALVWPWPLQLPPWQKALTRWAWRELAAIAGACCIALKALYRFCKALPVINPKWGLFASLINEAVWWRHRWMTALSCRFCLVEGKTCEWFCCRSPNESLKYKTSSILKPPLGLRLWAAIPIAAFHLGVV